MQAVTKIIRKGLWCNQLTTLEWGQCVGGRRMREYRDSVDVRPQSTYMPAVPQYLSTCPNWDPAPLPKASVFRPGTNGGDTLACVLGGWEGGLNSDD
jgi:hypothetical protein